MPLLAAHPVSGDPADLPRWVAQGSPESQKPMTSKVERVAGPLRVCAETLAAELDCSEQDFRDVLAPRAAGLGFRLEPGAHRERAAWALIAQWLVGHAAGAIASDDPISAAESWFLNGTPRAAERTIEQQRLARGAAGDRQLEVIADLIDPSETFALLPYLLDPLAPATRRCVLRGADVGDHRRARKEGGIYYTPADVAVWMARSVADSQTASVIDPACGSGVFLRAAQWVTRGSARYYGIDIDPLTAELCCFVLLAGEIAQRVEAPTPWAAWHRLRLDVATADALLLRPARRDIKPTEDMREKRTQLRTRLGAGDRPPPSGDRDLPEQPHLDELFPELTEGAEALLSNPPYAKLGDHPHRRVLAGAFTSFELDMPTPASNVFTLFVEHAWQLTASSAAASLIVPLSITYSRTAQLVGLRRGMERQPGRWEVACFDRTPDAIFGDDVKTRTAVLTYRAGSTRSLATTALLRWTSRTRASFFSTIKYTDLGASALRALIPKLGSPEEARLYLACRALSGAFGDALVDAQRRPPSQALATSHPSVIVAGTAYNWLSCAREDARVDDYLLSTSPVSVLRFADYEDAAVAYALLSGRLALWLWRVECDAFHVPLSFLRRLPLSPQLLRPTARVELSQLGERAWRTARSRPVVSTNGGRRTYGFTAAHDPELVDAIDEAAYRAFDLTGDADGFDLRRSYEESVLVGRDDPRRSARVMTKEALVA